MTNKKRNIFIYTLIISFIIISIGTFSWYTLIFPEGYYDLFYNKAISEYGNTEMEQLKINERKKLLKESIEVSIHKQVNNKLQIEIDFKNINKGNIKKSISENSPVNFSIPFYPVDLQYTAEIIEFDRDELYQLRIYLNEEYIKTALEENSPKIKPVFIKKTDVLSYLINLVSNFVISLISGILVTFLITNNKND